MKNKKTVLSIVLLIALCILSACSRGYSDDETPWPTPLPPSIGTPAPTPPPPLWVDVAPQGEATAPMPAPMPAAMEPPPFPEIDGNESLAGETHLGITENTWAETAGETDVSFTLQIDTASYRNVARMINSGHKPHPDAVRIAEMVNYFNYDTQAPFIDGSPFSVYTEIGPSPFNEDKHLAFVRVRAQDIDRSDLPPSNLTFLIDTSGSMAPHNRLPLLQQAFGLLVESLDENDIVSVATYAGCSRIVLDSVSGDRHDYIMEVINSLVASGGTAGGQGLLTAYSLAEKNFDPDMNNRIILATDGDFNVGVSTVAEISEIMAEHRRRGIHMTILGFGHGNFRDDMMETIAQNGNGSYHYIDTLAEAQKVFVEELISNLFVIAEEVRAQVSFNPQWVESYRLIGYENRLMDNADFDNDFRDAGEIGVGSEVVLLFELTLQESAVLLPPDAPLFEVRIRYNPPGETASRLIVAPAMRSAMTEQNSDDFTFAAAVAAFGHILRSSPYLGKADLDLVFQMAGNSLGPDRGGHRRGFIELAERYQALR